ncbi:MAG: hypothetical protein QOI78_333, partial [Actinomycetota bacterium]|nr:hypothetical protein [Actinomycetota bacterium]
ANADSVLTGTVTPYAVARRAIQAHLAEKP